MSVYLRFLEHKDAFVSYKWRNNEKVWKYTGSKPDIFITPEMEYEWISMVLKRQDELRFAICITKTDEYIGNTQLTRIKDESAEFHIFIGETKCWGKGYSKRATQQLINYAFKTLCLKEIYLFVLEDNKAAVALYRTIGFKEVLKEAGTIKMKINNNE